MGRSPCRIDIITSAEGATFSEIWCSRNMREEGKEKVPFIGIRELIKLKIAAGRPQDLIDIENLKLVQKLFQIRKKVRALKNKE